MKTKPSHYVLAVEILIIALFHAVKIKKEEKQSQEIVYTPFSRNLLLQKPIVENKNSAEYIFVNLVK
jgi:hypothetical protein